MEFTKIQSRMFEEYPISIHKISAYVRGKKINVCHIEEVAFSIKQFAFSLFIYLFIYFFFENYGILFESFGVLQHIFYEHSV
jgi:hypothetical protein